MNLSNHSPVRVLFIVVLLLFSIEYVGGDVLSVYRLLIFPISTIGLLLLVGKRAYENTYTLFLPVLFFFIWFSVCRLICDDNWLMPVFIVPFALFEILYLRGYNKKDIDYSWCFVWYSIPHIISWFLGIYNLDSGRFAGMHVDPNFCALFLIVSILASLFLIIRQRKKSKFEFFLLLSNIVICLYLLIWTGSRGAILSLVICSALIFWHSNTKTSVKLLVTLSFGISMVFLYKYILTLPNWVDVQDDMIGALLSRMKPESLLEGASRRSTWEIVFDRLSQVSIFTPLGRDNAMFGMGIDYTHNTYLDFLVECGVFVGSIAVVVIVTSCVKSLRLYFSNKLCVYDQEMLIIALAVIIQLFTLSALSQKILWLMLLFVYCLPSQYRRIK